MKQNLNETDLGVHFRQIEGLGQLTQAKLDKKGIKSPKIDPNKAYSPNGDKRLKVFQHPKSTLSREEWELLMDEKYRPRFDKAVPNRKSVR